jgi:hypothetical protein
MLSPLRNRFGIPGVISVIALVFAMFGGAYAATNSGGKATSSAKAKKGPRGPRGKTGPAGPAGPQGPAGANGKDGANGSNGADGVSVTTTTFATNKNGCFEGGVEVKSASPTVSVCNGEEGEPGLEGPPGPEGSPWTDGGTLPTGETETGRWAMGGFSSSFSEIFAPVSFPIPLAAPLDADHVRVLAPAIEKEILISPEGEFEEVTPTKCLGTEQVPTAATGYLCVYLGEVVGTFNPYPTIMRIGSVEGQLEAANRGAATSGSILIIQGEGGTQVTAMGSFAVTAP